MLVLLLAFFLPPLYSLSYDPKIKQELLSLNSELSTQTEILLLSLTTQSFSIDEWLTLSEAFDQRLQDLLAKVGSLENSDKELQTIIKKLKTQQYAFEALLQDSLQRLRDCQSKTKFWRSISIGTGGAATVLLLLLIFI